MIAQFCRAFFAFTMSTLAAAVMARAAEPPPPPVIIVPGIVGSRLCEPGPGGRVLWGAGLFYMGRLSELRLPVASGEVDKPVVPCGLLDKFSVLGPFDVDVYGNLVKFLVSAGYRDQPGPNQNLFIFDYDWRRSNLTSAARLKARVAEIKAKTGAAKVAIVAHSMGGIVSRIYLQSLDGASDVQTMVFFGTPHQGATQVLRTAQSGWGFLPNWIVGGEDVIRDTMFSWPSAYELIPLQKCCAVRQDDGAPTSFSATTAQRWARFGWMPSRYRSAIGQDYLQRVLTQAERVRDILNSPLPEGPAYEFIVSRSHPTAETAVFSPDYSKLERFIETPGDESVAFASAANGMVRQARVVPQKHTTLYDDDYAHYRLGRLLRLNLPQLFAKYESGARVLRVDRSSGATEACTDLTPAQRDATQPGGAQAVLIDDTGKPVCIWSFRLEAPRTMAAGEDVTVTLTLGGYSANFMRALTPTVRVITDDETLAAEHHPQSVAVSNLDGKYAATYRFQIKAPATPGNYRFDMTQDGLADKATSAYVIVYGPQAAP